MSSRVVHIQDSTPGCQVLEHEALKHHSPRGGQDSFPQIAGLFISWQCKGQKQRSSPWERGQDLKHLMRYFMVGREQENNVSGKELHIDHLFTVRDILVTAQFCFILLVMCLVGSFYAFETLIIPI